MARKNQHTQEILQQIKDMIASGMTQKEAENALGHIFYNNDYIQLKTKLTSLRQRCQFAS